MKLLRHFYKNEDGNVILISAFLFLALTALAGLVVDGGHLYLTKTHLQKTANAAVLSGAQQLTASDDTPVKAIVNDIVSEHGELHSVQNIDVMLGQKVTVNLIKPVSLFFSSLLGIDSVDIEAKATAKIGSMGRAYGAAPIGIPESVELVYGNPYTLKVDQDKSETGFFGALALDVKGGADSYEENLKHGFKGELSVGQIINTESGNMTGSTNKGVTYLMGQCDQNDPICPILLIPVYEPHNQGNGTLKEVKITGFAYFHIIDAVSDKEINGKFLKRVGSGFESAGASNKGAYTVKLTESE